MIFIGFLPQKIEVILVDFLPRKRADIQWISAPENELILNRFLTQKLRLFSVDFLGIIQFRNSVDFPPIKMS